jgi:hypothetical protein
MAKDPNKNDYLTSYLAALFAIGPILALFWFTSGWLGLPSFLIAIGVIAFFLMINKDRL